MGFFLYSVSFKYRTEISAEHFCISMYDSTFTYYMILHLYPVKDLYLTLAFFFLPKMFVLTVCNPCNCCYSTDSLAFSIKHLYFKTCNLHSWLLTPISFLFFTFGKCLFHRCFFLQDAFFPKKTPTFLSLEDHDLMDLHEYSDNQFTAFIKICHLCSHIANRCLRRQLCCPMKAKQKW